MKIHKPIPPPLARKLLLCFLREDLAEEVLGDLDENFAVVADKRSLAKAKLNYWYQVANYLRPFAIRKAGSVSTNQYDMFQSYFKISWRNLLKNKGFSVINIGGLTIGLTSFLLLFSYVQFERSYEDFNVNKDNIVRVTLDLYKGNEFLMTDCEMYAPFAALAKAELPEVKESVRVMNNDFTQVKVGTTRYFDVRSYFVDSTMFDVFTHQVVHGNLKKSLSKPYQAVLTTTAAEKYFGRTDVINELIDTEGGTYTVSAVIEPVPFNTHLKFDFLLSHCTLPKFKSHYTDERWESGNNEFTYLLVEPGTDLGVLNKKLKDLSASLKDKIGEDVFSAEFAKDIHLYSNKTYEPDVNGNAKTVFALEIIALFILGLAWVNYINLSTAKAVERAKEVGIRKVMGSARLQLVTQFLTESIIINLAAGIIAIGVVKIGYPAFRELTGQPLSDLFSTMIFWKAITAVVIIGIIFSGVYPAFVLASFQPVTVLKGKFKSSTHGQWLRKTLVIFQFGATTVLIISLSVVYQQIAHLRNLDLGMDISQTLVLRAEEEQKDSIFISKLNSFKTELMRNASVLGVSGTQSVPGSDINEISTTQSVFQVGQSKAGGSFNYYFYDVDPTFFPVLGVQFAAGRNFLEGSDPYDNVIINEEASQALGFTSPQHAIGAKITFGRGSTIIGVIKDFHQRSPKEPKLPLIFRYSMRQAPYIVLKVSSGDMQNSLESIKSTWSNSFPAAPFSYFFLNEQYDKQYRGDVRFGRVIATFSLLAIIIACLGLFGLSSFTILQRTKEIGIRKVLGGSVLQIARLLSRDFVTLVTIAALIAIPLGYFIMNEWLESYSTRITLSAWIFIAPLLIVIFISALTVSFQTIRAAQTNPVNSLKTE